MINRKIDKYLHNFFETHREALLITGARQTGKTFSVRQFGQSHFQSFIEINFIETPEAIDIFGRPESADALLLKLSAFTQKPLLQGRTLIFFDEVQECPEIVTAIKFLVDEGSYRYILSGSLLGVELKDIRSAPVGYMDVKEMFPLDFEEFISALGIEDRVIASVRNAFDEHIPADELIHAKLMELFRLYLIVGGMPSAVTAYIDSNNLQLVMEEQRAIITLYKKDIGKYDVNNKLYLEEIFNLIPPELNAQNKRFILKKLNENLKFSRYENSFLWLKDAGVALPVYNAEEPTSPLVLSRSRNLFKLFQNDVGLLACQYADGIQLRVLANDKNINFGGIYENAAAQELHAHGFDLYYFNSKKQGELDFVIEQDGYVVPIEVKSGKDYVRHLALSSVMNHPEYGLQKAYVFCNDNVKVIDKVIYLPVYMLMFLQKTAALPSEYKIDLTGLQKLFKFY